MAIAAPLLPHIDCDMPCCELEKVICCDSKMEVEIPKTCYMDMKSCDMGGLFIPIMAVPSHQFNLKIDLDVLTVVQSIEFYAKYHINFNPVEFDYPPDPPTAFNRPLLA
jgi:hypothetical protein